MQSFVEFLVPIYLMIGLLVGIFGPAGREISEHVERTRGSPLANAVMERRQPSELKLAVFRLIATVVFALLWPVFISGILKEQKQRASRIKEFHDRLAEGLWFQYSMGGRGNLRCIDCYHSEEVTSFIHGMYESVTGFQCQACGRFAAIESGGRGMPTSTLAVWCVFVEAHWIVKRWFFAQTAAPEI